MFGSDADRMVHPLCFSRAKTYSNKHGSTRSNHLVPIPGQPRTYTSKPSTLVTGVSSIGVFRSDISIAAPRRVVDARGWATANTTLLP